MLVVDSQVHVWAADTPRRPWLDGAIPHRSIPLGIDELLREMNAARVERAILVPPMWEGRRNDLALAAATAYPGRFAVMGRVDPAAPASHGTFAGLLRQPGLLGLRFAFGKPHLAALLQEGGAEWIWSEAEKAGMPLYVLVPQSLVYLIDEVAQRYPGLKLVMDHLALSPDKKDEAAFRDFDKLLPIAKRSNVAAKLSALPCHSTDTYPYRSLHDYIRKAYDAFGPKRLFWGTDISRSPLSYRENVTMFTDEIPWFTDDDKEWIMGRGVCEWLGWNPPDRSSEREP